MTTKQFKALVKQFDGWVDGEFVRFPTPYALEQFQKAAAGGEAR